MYCMYHNKTRFFDTSNMYSTVFVYMYSVVGANVEFGDGVDGDG